MKRQTRIVKRVLTAAVAWMIAGTGLRLSAVQLELLDVTAVDWRGGPHGGYGVFDLGEVIQAVSFKVKIVEGTSTNYFVTFSAGGSGNYQNRQVIKGGDSLGYQIYDAESGPRNVLKALPDATAGEVLSGAFTQENEVQELTYYILVPARQIKPAGNYTDTFTLTLYSGTLLDYTEQDYEVVTFSAPVVGLAELSFAAFDPNVRSATLDFGTLTTDAVREADMRIRSNAGYRVTMESENGGVLKHLSTGVTTVVPYSLRVGGNPVDLTGPAQEAAASQTGAVTDVNGDLHVISVTLGEVGFPVAGTYRDVVTVTIATNN